MIDLYLHGHLREKYGEHYRFEAFSAAECCRAMEANFGDFYETIKDGSYQMIRGPVDSGDELCPETLSLGLGNSPLHMVPVPAGSGGGGKGKGMIMAIIGIVIIAAAVIAAPAAAAGASALSGLSAGATIGGTSLLGMTYGQIAMIGASLALAGISAMIAQTPKVNNYANREDKKVSFLFDGAVNRIEQGGALPVVYGGPIRVGSVLVSGDIHVGDPNSAVPSDQVAVITTIGGYYIDSYGSTLVPYGIKPCGAIEVIKGKNMSFDIIPAPGGGYDLSDVKVDGVSQGIIARYTFFNVQANHTIEACWTETPSNPPDPYPN